MAKKNETKVTFSADVKPFTDAIKKSNSEMTKLRAELKLNEEQMKSNGTSVEGLEQKHKNLQAQVGVAQTKIDALNSKIEVATRYYGENSNEVTKLRTQLANASVAHEKLKQAVTACEAEIEAEKTAMQDTRTATERLTDTIQEQEKELETLKKRYSDFVVEGKEATQEAKDLEREIGKLSNELKSSKSALSDASDKAEELAKSLDEVEDSASNAEGGFTIMKDALGDLVADGIRVAVDAFKDLMTASSEASASFQAQTGATAEEMAVFNEEMQEMYANNYGESLQDIADKMSYVAHATSETDPSSIRELTENAIALEDTFGSDFNETIRGVSNLMTHFGISSEEAFDLFAKGSQEGLDYTGELGDNIAEYGGNFAQAGYTAEEYFQLLKNGAEGGAYNLDKVNDSINEAKNRLGDGSIGKNISLFSTGTQTLFTEWQNGNATMKDVIDGMVSDISNCKNETEALTMAQVAFGTMGEDANLGVVASLTTMGSEFGNVKGAMEEVKNVKYSDVGSQFEQIGRQIQTGIIQPLVDLAMPAIQGFANFIIENFDLLAPIIAGVASAFAVLAGALAIQGVISGVQKAMALLNTTMMVNPTVLIVAGITALIAIIATLWTNSEEFRNFFIGIWENIKTFCSEALDAIGGAISTAWETIKNTTSAVWEGIKSVISSIWEGIKTAISSVVEGVKNTVTGAWDAVKNTTSTVFNGVKSVASSVWNGLKSVVSGAVDGVKSKISNVWNSIKSTTSSVFNGIKSTATSVWNGVKNAITKPIETAKNKVKAVVDAIKGFFSGLKLKLPKIKLPHFKIKGKLSLDPPSVPKLTIEWYKKGAIFTKPTIFETANGLKGVGEAGAEAVLPIEKLENYVVNAIEKTQQKIDFSEMANAIERLAERAIELKINDRTIAEAVAGASDSVNGLRNIFRDRGLAIE